MRIAIYADRLDTLGGLETHVISQANELLRRGHRVLLSANAIAHSFLQSIKGDPINFTYAPFSTDPLIDLEGFSPDLVHAHPFGAIYRGYKVACAFDVPLFITIHGLYSYGVDRSPSGNPVAGKASKIIAIDQTIESALRKSISYPEKVVTIYNSINREDFFPADADPELISELGIMPAWKTIVVVSRLADGKEKSVFRLMDNAPLLAQRLDGLNIIIVGDGAHRDEVWGRNSISIESCQPLKVCRVGRRTDVARFIHLADLLLACGRAAMEAMACKRPVFAAYNGCFAGLVNNSTRRSVTSWEGYSEWSDQELVEGLYNSLVDDLQRETAIRESYELVEEYYDIHKATDMLELLFKESLGQL